MLHGAEWLGKKYASLAGPGKQQTLETTLITLASRLTDTPSTELAPIQDRKAAVLALKGLARDHPREVGDKALPALLESLQRDTKAERGVEDEMARAIVECLLALLESPASQPNKPASLPPHVLHHVDAILARPGPLHSILPLLSPARSFYTRFASLQLLATLTRLRTPSVQEHLLTSPGGCGAVLACLAEGSGSSAEIVRNEALLLIPRLVESNADIQKLFAFEGAFEKLIDVVAQEGRIEGGLIVQDALEGLESLLRWNVSNQNYFRETLSVPLLAPLLYYPPPPPNGAFPSRQAEQEHARQLEAFAFQSWEDADFGAEEQHPEAAAAAAVSANGQGAEGQKARNARLVIGIARLLVEGQGDGRRANQNALLASGFTRALLELSLASTAPVGLKAQAFNVLSSLLNSSRSTQDLLSSLLICPLLGIEAQPEEIPAGPDGAAPPPPKAPLLTFTRLPARPAILCLIDAAVSGLAPAVARTAATSACLGYRAAALSCFDAFVADNLDARLGIISTMAPPPSDGSNDEEDVGTSAGSLLLQGLAQLPAPQPGAKRFDAYRHLFSALLFCSLVRGSETAKSMAREIRFGPDGKPVYRKQGSKPNGAAEEEEDEEVSLIHVLIGNLTMAQREMGEAVRRERNATAGAGAPAADLGAEPSSTDWTRIIVGYLSLLAVWLWDSKPSVSDLLSESSNLQTLVQPAAQSGGGVDVLIAGLCTLILGIAYEWGAVPGTEGAENSIDRGTMHPILNTRIGPDQFAARLARLRDDVRIKDVGPDVLETISSRGGGPIETSEDGLWFDWPFVEWLKNNFVLIQKSITIEPTSSSADAAAATAELLDAQRQAEHLRDTATRQAREVELLESKLQELTRVSEEERASLTSQLAKIQETLDLRERELAESRYAPKPAEAPAEVSSNDAQPQTSAEAEAAAEKAKADAAAAEERAKAAEGRLIDLQKSKEESDKKLSDALTLVEKARADAESAKAEIRKVKKDAEDAVKAASTANTSAATTAKDGKGEGEVEGEKSKEELEKELEDLLILLDELTQKRVRDKNKMREKGIEVSEDEADEEDDEDDDE
ncbi:related to transport protein uso1 [Ceraceosorus bombacis]|uniref:Related to transport protein uso1 n=1 Tax=Ceraceosorus bombacis TaxID=401625 RepID=A0A0N7L8X0_9BASI|nr:related to transport protein uso1 [Ceraceosorus bombacis]